MILIYLLLLYYIYKLFSVSELPYEDVLTVGRIFVTRRNEKPNKGRLLEIAEKYGFTTSTRKTIDVTTYDFGQWLIEKEFVVVVHQPVGQYLDFHLGNDKTTHVLLDKFFWDFRFNIWEMSKHTRLRFSQTLLGYSISHLVNSISHNIFGK